MWIISKNLSQLALRFFDLKGRYSEFFKTLSYKRTFRSKNFKDKKKYVAIVNKRVILIN